MAFETKDSGERAAFASGMVRDTQDGKPRYGLIPRGPLKRVAELYARGAEKYTARNWEQAEGDEELERFAESAFRHLMQLLDGEADEDHGAAVVFNVFAIMWLRDKIAAANPPLGRTLSAAELEAAHTAPDIAGRDIDVPVRRRRCETCPVPACSVTVENYEGCTWPACHA